MSAVRQIMKEWGVEDINMIGVAKGIDRDAGNEEFYRTGKPVKALRRNDPVLYSFNVYVMRPIGLRLGPTEPSVLNLP